jgi:uncharacterized protein (DUF305 family)
MNIKLKKPGFIVGALGVLVLIVGGVFVIKATQDADRLFIEEMIPHHEEAVSSSKALLARTTDAELRVIASRVISAQEQEIALMKSWYVSWYGTEYKPTGVYMSMMSPIDKVTVQEAEQQYTSEMITHHEHAVMMAKEIISTTDRAELSTLSRAIILDQESEIAELKDILLKKFGQTPKMMDHSSH